MPCFLPGVIFLPAEPCADSTRGICAPWISLFLCSPSGADERGLTPENQEWLLFQGCIYYSPLHKSFANPMSAFNPVLTIVVENFMKMFPKLVV